MNHKQSLAHARMLATLSITKHYEHFPDKRALEETMRWKKNSESGRKGKKATDKIRRNRNQVIPTFSKRQRNAK